MSLFSFELASQYIENEKDYEKKRELTLDLVETYETLTDLDLKVIEAIKNSIISKSVNLFTSFCILLMLVFGVVKSIFENSLIFQIIFIGMFLAVLWQFIKTALYIIEDIQDRKKLILENKSNYKIVTLLVEKYIDIPEYIECITRVNH